MGSNEDVIEPAKLLLNGQPNILLVAKEDEKKLSFVNKNQNQGYSSTLGD